jgi:protein-S-isoprenylcysteine O-methyltransferase Ste14
MSVEKNNADNPGVIAPPPLIYAGISALANALPAALLLPLVLRLMRRGVIEREERYLERKFGDEYIEYKVRTPRWI